MAKEQGKPGQPGVAVADEVQRLIAAGKAKQAVELAKEAHKRQNTPESERALVDAYLARIGQFQEKGAAEDAATLLKLVRDRFPAHRPRLAELELKSAAIGGKVGDLVAPLARPDTPDDLRHSIETTVRQQVVDLPGLATVTTLPADHPLKVAAAAAWRAFQAVTEGPVTDEQIALPEISRRSPLAGWKMLTRALAAFYRHDDEGCRRALEGIPEDAAVAKLAPALTAMMEGRSAGTGLIGALQGRVGGDDQPLRAALDQLERVFVTERERDIRRLARQALSACSKARPELLEPLRRQIIARAAFENVPPREVSDIFYEARKDAAFWRIFARAIESGYAPSNSVVYWERFIRHALHERLIQPGSLEEAATWLHMAGQLAIIPPHEVLAEQQSLQRSPPLSNYYNGQPPEIAAVKPTASNAQLSKEIYDPMVLFERSARIDPAPQTFQLWWGWAQRAGKPAREQERVAESWRQLRPGDPQPLLHLSALAEERNALKLALKHLSSAEAIDALNPAVRKARLRLTLATAWRHFKDNRPHLVEQDLAELEKLPAMQEGTRPVAMGALRAALHALRGQKVEAQQAADAIIGRFGPLLPAVVIDAVLALAKLDRSSARPNVPGVALPEPRAVAEAQAQAFRLSEDLGLAAKMPSAWNKLVIQVLKQQPCPLSHADLLAIGNGALQTKNNEMAYLATSAGLASAGGPVAARFLVLRAKALPMFSERRERQCLRAAMELAQQAHDLELMREVSDALDQSSPYSRVGRRQPLGDQILADVMKREREAREHTTKLNVIDSYVVTIENDPGLFDPFPGAGGGYEADYDDYDDDEEDEYGYGMDFGDEEDDDFGDEYDDPINGIPLDLLPELAKHLKLPKGMPPEAIPLILKIMTKHGRLPMPDELFQIDPQLAAELAALFDQIDSSDSEADEPHGGFGGRRNKKKRKKRRR